MCDNTFLSVPNILSPTIFIPKAIALCVLIFVEWKNKDKVHSLAIAGYPHWLQLVIYFSLAIFIYLFGAKAATFIYFQF